MNVTFETRRLYVAARKSALFFAKVGYQRIRCYVLQDALVETVSGLRDEADLYQRCLLSFDQHRDAIQAAALRLIEASVLTADGAVIGRVRRSALGYIRIFLRRVSWVWRKAGLRLPRRRPGCG